jgi:hypothetical protein
MLAIARAHRIRMQRESPGKLSRAGQPITRLEIAAQNRKNNLRHQLPIDWNFAAMSKPESHARPHAYCATQPG